MVRCGAWNVIFFIPRLIFNWGSNSYGEKPRLFRFIFLQMFCVNLSLFVCNYCHCITWFPPTIHECQTSSLFSVSFPALVLRRCHSSSILSPSCLLRTSTIWKLHTHLCVLLVFYTSKSRTISCEAYTVEILRRRSRVLPILSVSEELMSTNGTDRAGMGED